MKKILLAILILIAAATINASRLPSITLAWDPNDEPEFKGYSIYVQEDDGAFTWLEDFDEIGLSDPLHPQVTIQGLNPRDFYYFAATAYSENQESDFSNLACGKLVPGYDYYIGCDYRKPAKKKNGGNGGGGCFISIIQGKQ